MEYDLATNFDNEVINIINKYDKEKSIKTVFGKLRNDMFGGGRISMISPKISFEKLKEYIQDLNRIGVRFNYLINSVCLGNQEYEKNYHKKMLRFIETLMKNGVSEVTLNIPYLCELVKRHFPELLITIGLNSRITDLQLIKYWAGFGADELTLHHTVNRNFGMLEKMLISSKDLNVKLRLIANNACLHQCPYEIYHGTGAAHASQSSSSSKDLYIDYCLASCFNKKVRYPSKIIASEWIRPEDVIHYEKLCEKTGNYNLSLKLLERTKKTEFIERVVKAYTSRSFTGNLISIINWASREENKEVAQFKAIRKYLTSGYSLRDIPTMYKIYDAPLLYIDNKKLDGFLSKFMRRYNCNERICVTEDMNATNSDIYCSYCMNWAQKVMAPDLSNRRRTEWLSVSDKFLDDLGRSNFYNRVRGAIN